VRPHASLLLAIALLAPASLRADAELLNVSYDPTRELYADYNALFAKHWLAQTGETVTIHQSHGGSGKQGRAVIDGLEADVVTLALAGDIDALSQRGNLLPRAWQKRLPNESCPYTSTVVFLVRAGNPKKIRDWEDLGRPGIGVIPANPKTSGAARWAYFSIWGYGLRKYGGDETQAKALLTAVYRNVPVFDTGARGATTTFVERGIGDVLVGWENEALLAQKEAGPGKLELVAPTLSIYAQPPVAVVDAVARRHGTAKVAEAYLKYLYSPEAQELAAKHFYRPSDPAVLAKYASQFQKIELFKLTDFFPGGWAEALAKHINDGGIYDQILRAGRE
jgi:sulfate transport system substrate-binding protein